MFDKEQLKQAKDLKKLRKTETLLVGFDYDETNRDESVLVIGRKRVNRDAVEIINAFHGKEARELYDKLAGIK